jgi:hypothetical protein
MHSVDIELSQMGDQWSSADGIGVVKAKRISCSQRCLRHYLNDKSKRASCMTGCDNAYSYEISQIKATLDTDEVVDSTATMPQQGVTSGAKSRTSISVVDTDKTPVATVNPNKYILIGVAVLLVLGGTAIYFARKK